MGNQRLSMAWRGGGNFGGTSPPPEKNTKFVNFKSCRVILGGAFPKQERVCSLKDRLVVVLLLIKC